MTATGYVLGFGRLGVFAARLTSFSVRRLFFMIAHVIYFESCPFLHLPFVQRHFQELLAEEERVNAADYTL